jgi:hypothetical protein
MRVGLSALLLGVLSAAVLVGQAGAQESRLGAEERTALAVTIYGGGLALVRDQRAAVLKQGGNRLAFEGVSRQMIPSSAVLGSGAGVRVAEIDYDFDLLTPEALLRRSVGHEVEVVRTHPTTGEDTVETATLLGAEGGVVLRYRDRVEIGMPGRLVFKHLPEDLRPLPSLVAGVDSDAAGRRELELSYLTTGLSWQADYVVALDETTGRLDIAGRATLTNVSGTDYREASVGLIAGQVNRVSQPAPRPQYRTMEMAAAMPADAASMPAREAVGDLHLYRLERPVTIDDRQTKQVALLAAEGVPFVREYISEAGVQVFGRQPGEPRPTHPQVVLRFDNAEADGPGVPLPAGVARVYTRDSTGAKRLLGEDQLDNTPVGESVELTPGEAFDVTVKRRQTDFVRAGLPDGVFESAYRLEVNNAKAEEVTVKLVEIIPGDWKILEESAAHETETAERLVWRLAIPAKGTAELTYRVRVHR